MSIIKIDTGKTTTQGLVYKKFEIYDLVKENNPILKTPCQDIDFNKPQIDPVYLASSMFETMFHYKGIGLSAPQCGLPYRVFVVGYEEDNKQVFFNPKVLDQSEEFDLDIEGCLSYNGLFLNILRPKWIALQWQHVNGEVKENTFHGLTARVLLHELDHCDGISFVTKVSRLSYSLARERRTKQQKILGRSKKREAKNKS